MIRDVHSNLLFVGNALDARDLRLLYDTGIRAVIDLAINEPPAQLGREIVYCRFPLNDGDGNDDALIALAVRTTVSLIGSGIPTLVACSAGMSRAPTIAAASIALRTGRNPDDCLVELISNAPNDVSPILWAHIKRVYNADR
ncbi:MAG: dual specificity protein phosphatase family protein [Planctomycetes bacterium]|nr:dual specificity protein phosphatase family protein [Planctomycetota bacterium]